MSNEHLKERLNEHLIDALNSNASIKDWFIIGVQGSQNYELDNAYSDIDSKLLTIPTVEEVALNKKPLSYTHIMENNEHCDVKDTRLYFEILYKQNINFVELLFSKCLIVNEKYRDIWNKLYTHREQIARYDIDRTLQCMKGMLYQKQHQLCPKDLDKSELINKYGFDPKQLSHLLRTKDFTEQYMSGAPYAQCLIPRNKEHILEVKRNLTNYTKEEAINIANDIVIEMSKKIDEYESKEKDETAKKFLENLQIKLIKKAWNIKERIINET